MIDFNWSKIKNGYAGFEKLACRYVEKHFQSPSKWEPTQATRDGNKDAITIIFGFHPNGVANEQWWMEAKYSTSLQKLSRYRLDATIVSAILSEHISKIIFVTNIIISPKTIVDIRTALQKAVGCQEVFFASKYSLEYWLSQNSEIMNEFFGNAINFDIELPDFFITNEMEIFNKFNNHLSFHESLHHIIKGQIYHGYFSVFSKYNNELVIESSPKQKGIQILSDKKLLVESGESQLHIIFRLEDNFSNIITKEAESPIFLINNQELLLKYNPEPIKGHSKIKIQEQEDTKKKIIEQLSFFLHNPETKICILTGISGIGKSYMINEFLTYKPLQREILFSIEFMENGYENINILINIIFFILYPYMDPADLDENYLMAIKNDNFITSFILQLLKNKHDFEQLEAIMETSMGRIPVFPNHVYINKRVIILDDCQKMNRKHRTFLFYILEEIYIKKIPVFILLCGQSQILDDLYSQMKYTFFSTEIRYQLTEQTIINHINSYGNLTFRLDVAVVKTLFDNLVELFIFVQYLQDTAPDINSLEDFILFCNLFKRMHLYEEYILNKFKTLKRENEKEYLLCSTIYWSLNGVDYENIHVEFLPYVTNLLSKNFIKYNHDNKIISYQDIEMEIFRKYFPRIEEKNILITYNKEVDSLHMIITKSSNRDELLQVVKDIEILCNNKKFYTVFYILEDIFEQLNTDAIKNRVTDSIFYRLYRSYALASTNLSKKKSGSSIFKKIYYEIQNSDDIDIIFHVKTSILWELQNSSFEWLDFDQSEMYAKEQMATIQHLIQLKVLKPDKNNFIRYQNMLVIQTLIESEKNVKDVDENFLKRYNIMMKYKFYQRALSFKVRFAHTLLTRNLALAETMLRESMENIFVSCGDTDKFYLWASTGYYFIQLIKNSNSANLSSLLMDLEKMKQDYYNDYRKRKLAMASYYLSLHDIESGKKALFFDITTERGLRPRQEGFYYEILALLELLSNNASNAIQELDKAKKIFQNLPEYVKIIDHNQSLILLNKCPPENIVFYIGGNMKKNCYYLDPRCLY